MNREELVLELKNIEKKMGRLPEHKPIGKIIIDIDLIKWDDEIVKPEDYKRSYIRDLLPELVDL
jgi:2-amino-4-hydroxy-6-hydroxymethyldihydropteridine diphosphokinase